MKKADSELQTTFTNTQKKNFREIINENKNRTWINK